VNFFLIVFQQYRLNIERRAAESWLVRNAFSYAQ
jgi:hypothetical protein